LNEQNTLLNRFSFQDGHISTVCPGEDEPVWALNIKKAVLSTFQNRMERFDIHHIVAEVDRVFIFKKTSFCLVSSIKLSV